MIYVVDGVVVALAVFTIIDEVTHVRRLYSLKKWFDEDTGLPMHAHPIATVSNDGYDFDIPSPSRCNCGNKAFDIPLSTVQSKQSSKGDH